MKGKAYVRVRARTETDGTIIPEALVLQERCLVISRVLERRETRQTREGGSGTRYTVACGQASLYLFMDEERRWFVEDERYVRQIPCDDGG